MNESSRVEEYLVRLKNYRVLALLIVGGVILYAGFKWADALLDLWYKLKPQSGLEIVSVRVIDDPQKVQRFRGRWLSYQTNVEIWPPRFSLVDVMVRNLSSEVHVIRSIELAASQVATADTVLNCAPLIVSWGYHLLLDGNQQYQKLTYSMGQSIEPNRADRFVLILAHTGAVSEARYRLHGRLRYDQDSALELGAFNANIRSACGSGSVLDQPIYTHHSN